MPAVALVQPFPKGKGRRAAGAAGLGPFASLFLRRL